MIAGDAPLPRRPAPLVRAVGCSAARPHGGAGAGGCQQRSCRFPAVWAAALGDVASHVEEGMKFGLGEGGGVSSPRRHGEGPEHVGKKAGKVLGGQGRRDGAGVGGVG